MNDCLVTKMFSEVSDNNLPIFTEITEETLQKLAAFVNLDENYIYNFQVFIDEIGGYDGSIYSKLHQLYIPIFSQDTDELYFDVKRQAKILPAQYATYSRLERGFGIELTRPLSYICNTITNGVFIFSITDEPTDVDKYVFSEFGSCAGFIANFAMLSYTAPNNPIYFRIHNTVLFSCGADNANSLITVDGVSKSIPAIWNLDTAYSVAPTIYKLLGSYTAENQQTGIYKMFGVGAGLTLAEANTLSTAINNFYKNMEALEGA